MAAMRRDRDAGTSADNPPAGNVSDTEAFKFYERQIQFPSKTGQNQYQDDTVKQWFEIGLIMFERHHPGAFGQSGQPHTKHRERKTKS
jgi:hypothetical protein